MLKLNEQRTSKKKIIPREKEFLVLFPISVSLNSSPEIFKYFGAKGNIPLQPTAAVETIDHSIEINGVGTSLLSISI